MLMETAVALSDLQQLWLMRSINQVKVTHLRIVTDRWRGGPLNEAEWRGKGRSWARLQVRDREVHQISHCGRQVQWAQLSSYI